MTIRIRLRCMLATAMLYPGCFAGTDLRETGGDPECSSTGTCGATTGSPGLLDPESGESGGPATDDGSEQSEPPSAPSGLAVGVITWSRITLQFAPATDDDTPPAKLVYKLYEDGEVLADSQPGVTRFTVTGRLPETSYRYEVAAVDGDGREGLRSPPLVVTTAAVPPEANAIDETIIATADALERSNRYAVGAADDPVTLAEQYKVASPGDEAVFDLRFMTSTAFPYGHNYPLTIGTGTQGAGTVVVGGLLIGQQPRDTVWGRYFSDANGNNCSGASITMKGDYDGTGILIRTRDYVVIDGMRLENMMDDIRPQPRQRFVLRNVWSQHTHDDPIENDQHKGGLIHDCLFEGGHVFLSQQKGAWNGAYPLEISHTLAATTAKTYELDNTCDPSPNADDALVDGKGHAQFWKYQGGDYAPIYVHDSVFLIMQESLNGEKTMRFPMGSNEGISDTYSNNILIWVGDGSDNARYPHPLPEGVTEYSRGTTNPSTGANWTREELLEEWQRHVDVWKARHGITGDTSRVSTASVDMAKMIAPDPFVQ